MLAKHPKFPHGTRSVARHVARLILRAAPQPACGACLPGVEVFTLLPGLHVDYLEVLLRLYAHVLEQPAPPVVLAPMTSQSNAPTCIFFDVDMTCILLYKILTEVF